MYIITINGKVIQYKQLQEIIPLINCGKNFEIGNNAIIGNNFKVGDNFRANHYFYAGNNFSAFHNFKVGSFFKAGDNFNVGNNFEAKYNFSAGNNFKAGDNFKTGIDFKAGDNFTAGDNFLTRSRFKAGNDFEVGNNFLIGNGFKVRNDAKIKNYCQFSDIYTYTCFAIVTQDNRAWVQLGCYFRSVEDWIGNFWNNNDEFPNDGSKESEDRLKALELCLHYFNTCQNNEFNVPKIIINIRNDNDWRKYEFYKE